MKPNRFGVRRILSIGADAKTIKGEKLGVRTAILYLSPGRESGRNFCANASAGCLATCLKSAGRMVMHNAERARANRSAFLIQDRGGFLDVLRAEIRSLEKSAARRGMRAAVRLDGTSDIGLARLLAPEFPRVTFYDYTKDAGRMAAFLDGAYPSNYSLTFSWSETNAADCARVLARGGNVAVPFAAVPKRFGGFRVLDGDASDFRPADSRGRVGRIVGLKAKGRARRDVSGFVVRDNAARPFGV